MPAITMYTRKVCPYCDRAKHLLARKGQTWTEIDVEAEPGRRAEMIERTGRRTVPQIFVGDRHLGGSDELYALEETGELDSLLGLTRKGADGEAPEAVPRGPVVFVSTSSGAGDRLYRHPSPTSSDRVGARDADGLEGVVVLEVVGRGGASRTRLELDRSVLPACPSSSGPVQPCSHSPGFLSRNDASGRPPVPTSRGRALG